MSERLAVLMKLIVLAAVAAGIGVAVAVASGPHSARPGQPRAVPVVIRVVRSAEPRAVRRPRAFRPPAVGVRTVKALPPTGFGLESVVAIALAVVAAGLLFRQVAAGL